jgi:acetyltransferase-like isoleucine patch superfamily enzyme
MNKFWNGRLMGLPHAVVLFLGAAFHNLGYRLFTFFYKKNLGKCGKGVILMPGLKFRYPKTIELGNHVTISKNVELSRGEIETGRLVIEDGASIDTLSFIDYAGGIIMHKNAHIAWGSYITTHDHGYDYRNKPVGKPLEIGENAFIGAKSTILFNCNRIGNNAVVGMGSVVTKDVPNNAIVAGNPARIIKYRDDI